MATLEKLMKAFESLKSFQQQQQQQQQPPPPPQPPQALPQAQPPLPQPQPPQPPPPPPPPTHYAGDFDGIPMDLPLPPPPAGQTGPASAQAAAAERRKREEHQRWYEKEKARLEEERDRKRREQERKLGQMRSQSLNPAPFSPVTVPHVKPEKPSTLQRPQETVIRELQPQQQPRTIERRDLQYITVSQEELSSGDSLSPDPWKRDAREKLEKQQQMHIVDMLSREIQELQNKPERSAEENDRLRKLMLEWQFQKRLQESKQKDEDDEEEEDDDVDTMLIMQRLEAERRARQTALPAISVLDLVCSHFFPLVLFSCLDFLFFSQWWWFCVSSRPVPRGVLVQDSSCLSRSMPAVCLDLVPLCFSPLILSVTVCLWFLTFSQS